MPKRSSAMSSAIQTTNHASTNTTNTTTKNTTTTTPPTSTTTTTTTTNTPTCNKESLSEETLNNILHLALQLYHGKKCLFVTGAGLSVSSGIATYRGDSNSVWSNHIIEMGTRRMFQSNPLDWYNNFWLQTHHRREYLIAKPNEGHYSIARLSKLCNVRVITQNIDHLHLKTSLSPSLVIEVHGRLGLYKCINQRKKNPCPYSKTLSIDSIEIMDYMVTTTTTTRNHSTAPTNNNSTTSNHSNHQEDLHSTDSTYPARTAATFVKKKKPTSSRSTTTTRTNSTTNSATNSTRNATNSATNLSTFTNNNNKNYVTSNTSSTFTIHSVPKCPSCCKPVLPQALLFDEKYESHDFYQWQKAMEWIGDCDLIVFVGTSFSVGVTAECLSIVQEQNKSFHDDEECDKKEDKDCNECEKDWKENKNTPPSRKIMYNFNMRLDEEVKDLNDMYHVIGRSECTLPLLYETLVEIGRVNRWTTNMHALTVITTNIIPTTTTSSTTVITTDTVPTTTTSSNNTIQCHHDDLKEIKQNESYRHDCCHHDESTKTTTTTITTMTTTCQNFHEHDMGCHLGTPIHSSNTFFSTSTTNTNNNNATTTSTTTGSNNSGGDHPKVVMMKTAKRFHSRLRMYYYSSQQQETSQRKRNLLSTSTTTTTTRTTKRTTTTTMMRSSYSQQQEPQLAAPSSLLSSTTTKRAFQIKYQDDDDDVNQPLLHHKHHSLDPNIQKKHHTSPASKKFKQIQDESLSLNRETIDDNENDERMVSNGHQEHSENDDDDSEDDYYLSE
ncbi:hypothetical protein FDP41_000391 [Naegleria fowleri]|uniref:Deacetylase sirtuin-type domain-containing protein n=1 Tax=Naegleria fowleri TaxID=5763 RepID=A0A6A5CBR4_NAEFO|nr:uncharacterized protein FDP41_000391 [Naegleria fowleri]KAF0984492.1 hypothetical protein FDP41_000391 [Naegleria fowleri]